MSRAEARARMRARIRALPDPGPHPAEVRDRIRFLSDEGASLQEEYNSLLVTTGDAHALAPLAAIIRDGRREITRLTA